MNGCIKNETNGSVVENQFWWRQLPNTQNTKPICSYIVETFYLPSEIYIVFVLIQISINHWVHFKFRMTLRIKKGISQQISNKCWQNSCYRIRYLEMVSLPGGCNVIFFVIYAFPCGFDFAKWNVIRKLLYSWI